MQSTQDDVIKVWKHLLDAEFCIELFISGIHGGPIPMWEAVFALQCYACIFAWCKMLEFQLPFQQAMLTVCVLDAFKTIW